jgi:hypothetical protein
VVLNPGRGDRLYRNRGLVVVAANDGGVELLGIRNGAIVNSRGGARSLEICLEGDETGVDVPCTGAEDFNDAASTSDRAAARVNGDIQHSARARNRVPATSLYVGNLV